MSSHERQLCGRQVEADARGWALAAHERELSRQSEEIALQRDALQRSTERCNDRECVPEVDGVTSSRNRASDRASATLVELMDLQRDALQTALQRDEIRRTADRCNDGERVPESDGASGSDSHASARESAAPVERSIFAALDRQYRMPPSASKGH